MPRKKTEKESATKTLSSVRKDMARPREPKWFRQFCSCLSPHKP